MSKERPGRSFDRLDYKVYHKTGKRVVRQSKELDRISENYKKFSIMAAEKIIDEEKKVCLKINRFIDEYDFELLFDIEDVEKGISEFKILIEKYEEIHVELKRELDDQYDVMFGDFAAKLKIMTDWVKKAKTEIKRRKIEKFEKEERVKKEKEEREEQVRREKEEKEKHVRLEKEEKEEQIKRKLRIEEKYFTERIEQDLTNMVEQNSDFVEDIERNVTDIKELIKGYSELFVRIENVFGEEFSETYHQQIFKMNKLVREFMDLAKQKKLFDVKFKEENDHLKNLREEKLRNIEREENIHTFNGIFENIRERALVLKSKCIISLEELSDSQVLERMKDVKSFDSEYNEILNWITELIKVSPSDYKKTDEVLYKARNAKSNLKKLKDDYQENLEQEIVKRELNSDKIKDSSLLKLDVPKYHGYGSSLDFYTFKSEFEKLISPRIRAKLLPDYLKNNYLEGQALQIVKEIHEIDKIWERLKSSFGNVEILLNNKLSEIVKYGPLWKIKNEETVIQVMTKLINGMTDLATLAKKHNIEETLFHPSNLVKIYDIIGRKRQFKCMKQCIVKEIPIKDEWENIITNLNFELKLKEKALCSRKQNQKKVRYLNQELMKKNANHIV